MSVNRKIKKVWPNGNLYLSKLERLGNFLNFFFFFTFQWRTATNGTVSLINDFLSLRICCNCKRIESTIKVLWDKMRNHTGPGSHSKSDTLNLDETDLVRVSKLKIWQKIRLWSYRYM